MAISKKLYAFFFEDISHGIFRCKICGNERKQLTGTGYMNLIAHLKGKHEGYQDQFDAFQVNRSQPLHDFGFVSEKANHRFQWMRWIIERNMPLCEVDDKLTRAMSRLQPISSKTLKHCMEKVAIKVGSAVEEEMGSTFGVMFDGWSNASVHYVAVYAVCEVEGVLRLPLLCLSPLEGGSQSADAHLQLITNILGVYNKTKEVVDFLISDNCSTDQSMTTKMGSRWSAARAIALTLPLASS
ncbi:hypothetical protein BBJ28_00026336 [Nothophytophthora sp. Chile5]|nr:hypothetical protein BBJ28_00026336 [Nothophytophthora sp. Chile5]